VEPGKVEVGDVPTPEPGRDEILIRVRKAGICGTDYPLFSGELAAPFPTIYSETMIKGKETLQQASQRLCNYARVS